MPSYTPPTTESAPPAVQLWGYDDLNGYYRPFVLSGDAIRVISQPYQQALAEGDIVGHTPFSKRGFLSAAGTAAETVWTNGGVYAFPAAAGVQMTVVSSNANDTSAGSGARTVYINYLDPTGASATATAALNGTTPANIGPSNVWRINNFRVATTGAGLTTAGNITLASGGVTYGFISAGMNSARTCVYTVPLGKTLYVTSIFFSAAGNKYVRFISRANYDNAYSNGAGQILPSGMFIGYTEALVYNTSVFVPLEQPTKFSALTDIKIDAIPEGAGAVCACSIKGWVE